MKINEPLQDQAFGSGDFDRVKSSSVACNGFATSRDEAAFATGPSAAAGAHEERAAALVTLDQLYCFPVYLLLNKFNKIYAAPLQALGLSYSQLLVMLILWEKDGRNFTDISRRLRFESGVLAPILNRLEAAGYIERQRQTHDRRQVHLHVTAMGMALQKKHHLLFKKLSEHAAKAGCHKQEMDAFRETVLNLLDRFDQLQDPSLKSLLD